MIQTDWLVGYSKIDINPWLDPKDHSKGLLLPDKDDDGNYIIAPNGYYQDGIPLAGYGRFTAKDFALPLPPGRLQ